MSDISDLIEKILEYEEDPQDHVHTCQQCDKVLELHCDCGKPNINVWCSSNCRAAFDL